MTDSEKLDLILNNISDLKSDMQDIKQDVANLKSDMQDVKQDVANLKSDMQDVKQKVANLELNMQDVKQKVANLELDMQDVKQKVSKIDITLESEIRDNIKRVAEGHFDLSRDLKEAKKSSNEMEMLTVRVNILESDVRKLKEKIS